MVRVENIWHFGAQCERKKSLQSHSKLSDLKQCQEYSEPNFKNYEKLQTH
jgi:hypothetical protein